MKLHCVAALAAFTVLCQPAFSQGENPNSRNEMQKMFHAWDKAMAAKDSNTILGMLAPNFVQRTAQGHDVTLSQFRSELLSLFSRSRTVATSTHVDHVYTNGDEVNAWLTVRMRYTMGGKPYVITNKMVNTVKRTPGGWMITYNQMLPRDN